MQNFSHKFKCNIHTQFLLRPLSVSITGYYQKPGTDSRNQSGSLCLFDFQREPSKLPSVGRCERLCRHAASSWSHSPSSKTRPQTRKFCPPGHFLFYILEQPYYNIIKRMFFIFGFHSQKVRRTVFRGLRKHLLNRAPAEAQRQRVRWEEDERQSGRAFPPAGKRGIRRPFGRRQVSPSWYGIGAFAPPAPLRQMRAMPTPLYLKQKGVSVWR